ncbi:tubulin polyglutamylase TTLL5-like isoform X1 [Argonauta hians]
MEGNVEDKESVETTKVGESDGEAMTPSEFSEDDHGNTSDKEDSDYQSEDLKSGSEDEEDKPNIKWTGYNKKIPVLIFHADAVLRNKCKYKKVGERFHMTFKFGSTESRIIRTVLLAHGFHEVTTNHSDYNLLWTGGHLKPSTLRGMADFQKINHFPRSYELTRKDKLYKNVQRMQQIKGCRNFNFVPMSFVIPSEYEDFCCSFCKDRGPWIIKPVASSRGRGVHLVSHPDQVPFDEHLIVSKYIQNPLLIDGFKFDIRLYVAVTSYDPLVVYLYEEGLTRFATVRYDKSQRSLKNQCMHLTNYSVNKKSQSYVKNDDPNIEDYGNKWSLGALLRYLKSKGVDTAAMMMKIEDVIVKTILSAELHIASASKMFVNSKWNCFELYGFDVLIDDTLKPWILEVNLSPSLVCDSPLDLKIKTNLICDLFSAIGIVCHDPMVKNYQQIRKNMELAAQMNKTKPMQQTQQQRRSVSAGSRASSPSYNCSNNRYMRRSMSGLNSEEIKIVRRVKEEESRKGGWIRLFPSPDSWNLYSPFLQFSTTHNLMLHQRLYPQRHKVMMYKCLTPINSLGSRTKSLYNNLTCSVSNLTKIENGRCESFLLAQSRAQLYERRLDEREKNYFETKDRRQIEPNQLLPAPNMESFSSKEELHFPSDSSISSSDISKPYHYCSLDGLEKPVVCRPGKETDKSRESSSTKINICKEQTIVKQSLLQFLLAGGHLSQLQARTAFALYLTKVQQRLLTETLTHSSTDLNSLSEQLDLVIRFLKRAAANLQRNFQIIAPSKTLAVKERCKLLAKELYEFVKHYKRETHHLREMLQKDSDASFTGITDEDFNIFMASSDENDLELVLTTYTKLRKSGSIFLGNCYTGDIIAHSDPKDIKNPKGSGDKNQAASKIQRIPSRNTPYPTKSILHSRCSSVKPLDFELPSPVDADDTAKTCGGKSIKGSLQSLSRKQQQRHYSAKERSRTLSNTPNSLPSAHIRSRSLDQRNKVSSRTSMPTFSEENIRQKSPEKIPGGKTNFEKSLKTKKTPVNGKSYQTLKVPFNSSNFSNSFEDSSVLPSFPKHRTKFKKCSSKRACSCPLLANLNSHLASPPPILDHKLSASSQNLTNDFTSRASDSSSTEYNADVDSKQSSDELNIPIGCACNSQDLVLKDSTLEFKFFQNEDEKPDIINENLTHSRNVTQPTIQCVSPNKQNLQYPTSPKMATSDDLYKADSCNIPTVPDDVQEDKQEVEMMENINFRFSTL